MVKIAISLFMFLLPFTTQAAEEITESKTIEFTPETIEFYTVKISSLPQKLNKEELREVLISRFAFEPERISIWGQRATLWVKEEANAQKLINNYFHYDGKSYSAEIVNLPSNVKFCIEDLPDEFFETQLKQNDPFASIREILKDPYGIMVLFITPIKPKLEIEADFATLENIYELMRLGFNSAHRKCLSHNLNLNKKTYKVQFTSEKVYNYLSMEAKSDNSKPMLHFAIINLPHKFDNIIDKILTINYGSLALASTTREDANLVISVILDEEGNVAEKIKEIITIQGVTYTIQKR